MRPRPFRSASLFVLAALVFAPSAHAQRWRFIVTGDSRSERLHSTRKGDKNGVNVTILKELALATLRERPAFLLFSGDLAFGASSDAGVESQLRTWVSAMQPVYDARIPVYAIRGNHDIGGRHPAAVWRRVFQGRYAMPMNGPLGEEGMTYSVAYQNALIVGLDQYRTDTVRVNQTWLDEVLLANRKQHVFFMAHEMAFRAGLHKDNMDEDPAARDRFWNSIHEAGGRTFFCGHDHLYDHTAIGAASWGASEAIHQFTVGTAGAPYYQGNNHNGVNGDWQLTPIKHIQNRFGYAVVDVDGPRVTITFKARKAPGVYVIADFWSYAARR